MSATQFSSGTIGGLRGPGGVVTPDMQTLHDQALAAATQAQTVVGGATNALLRTGASNADLASGAVGSLANTGSTNNSQTNALGSATPIPGRAVVKSLKLDVTAPLNVTVLVAKPLYRLSSNALRGRVLATFTVDLIAGVNTIDISSVGTVPAGTNAFVRINSGPGALKYANTSGSGGGQTYIQWSDWTASAGIGSVVPLRSVAGASYAIELDYALLPSTLADGVSANSLAIASVNAANRVSDSPAQSGSWAPGVPVISALTRGADAGADVPVGMTIDTVTAQISIASAPAAALPTASSFTLTVFSRQSNASDIDTDIVTGAETIIDTYRFTAADAGLVVDGGEIKISIPIKPFQTQAGVSYFASLAGDASSGLAGVFGVANGDPRDTANRQRRRGWYLRNTDSSQAPIPAGFAPMLYFSGYYAAPAAAASNPVYYDDTVTNASVTVTGLTISTSVTLNRAGSSTTYTDTRTIAYSAAGKTRYDVLCFNRATLAFDLLAGTQRATDAGEFIPTPTASGDLTIVNLRVSESAVEAIPVWNRFNGEVRDLATALEQQRRRSRQFTKKARGKIYRKEALHIMVLGDSIGAIASDVASTATPNGAVRDVATAPLTATYHYLRDAIGTPLGVGNDIVDAMPTFTSVQLGMADDGAGQIHTKFGFMWEILNGIQAEAGYALGNAGLRYSNFAIAGKASSDLITGSTPSAWLNNALALAPDLVVLHMGQNEYGSATTEANMIAVINLFKAQGAEVIVTTPPRKNASQSSAGWDVTTRALHRAAEYCEVALVSRAPFYDPRFTAAMGISLQDFCAANRNNHPGIWEHKLFGREGLKMLLG